MDKCRQCDGCGKVADTKDQEPWTAWTSLPLQSAGAVVAGLVKPIECPACGGTGEPPEPTSASDAMPGTVKLRPGPLGQPQIINPLFEGILYCRADKVVDKDVAETMAEALRDSVGKDVPKELARQDVLAAYEEANAKP